MRRHTNDLAQATAPRCGRSPEAPPAVAFAQLTFSVRFADGRVLELYVYVPFCRLIVHVVRPTNRTPVFLLTPGPTRVKLCLFEASVTTNVYFPAFTDVITLPSCRSVMNCAPTVP